MRNNAFGPREIAMTGLIGGLSVGVLSAASSLFFIFPMVAHYIFGTYMHYDASTLGYACGYVALLGLAGIPTSLVAAHALTVKSRDGAQLDEIPQP